MDRMVTVSDDCTARVWNLPLLYCESCYATKEEPLSVAIHPCGFELCIAFRSAILTYNIANDGLLPSGFDCKSSNPISDSVAFRELSLPGCRMMKFNPAGNWLAAVDASGRDIVVFETVHYKQIGKMDGHILDVKEICWKQDGMQLLSVSEQEVYIWSLESMTR